jgi:PhnB protein
MPKRGPADQLDQAIQAMLVSLRPRPEQRPSPALPALLRVAVVLRDLPRPEFRFQLKSALQRRTTMNEAVAPSPEKMVHFMRPGFTSITPYILVNGGARFIDFLKSAFNGVERLRVPMPDGKLMHAEVAIGNGMIELGDANDQYPATPVAIHLYVDDPDATYARALEAGATGLSAPTADHPSGDRWGTARDPFGNLWHIAKPQGWIPGSEGLRSVQPYLYLRDAHKAISFLEAAFGAEGIGSHFSPQGTLLHATMRIGNATLEISEAHGEFQPMPGHLHIYVPDTDALYAQALRRGATSVEAPTNKPYGDRAAGVKDPFGNTWFLATHLGSPNRNL